MTTYSQKQNAVRAAKKALADGSAPAPTYEIKGGKGGFRIAWDVAGAPAAPKSKAAQRWADTAPHGMAGVAPVPVERDEGIDTNEPGELSPEDEKLANGLANGAAEARAPVKAGTQLAKVTDLLKRAEGATIAEIQAVTGWLPHTTRAFISVQVRRKAGLEVTTDKVEGRGRVYRVAA